MSVALCAQLSHQLGHSEYEDLAAEYDGFVAVEFAGDDAIFGCG